MDEMTTTENTVNTDNSDVNAGLEPSNDDNSSITDINKEPENDVKAVISDDDELVSAVEAKTQGKKEVEKDLLLGKFETPEALAKSYQEVQSQHTKLSQEVAELRKKAEIADELTKQQEEIAKSYGFNSAQEMRDYQNRVQLSSEIANYQADQYAKYIDSCEYPDEMRNLLLQYRQTPSDELLETIEAEMPLSAIKQVAESMKDYKISLQARNNEILYQQECENVKGYLENVTQKYGDRFKNPAFTNLFGEAFKVLGSQLNADSFISLVDDYKKSAIQEYLSGQEYSKTTDNLSNLAPQGSKSPQGNNVNLENLSNDELDKIVGKLI